MYSLHLPAEQLEIRDTVRDFVTQRIKPVVLKAERLDACDRRLPTALLDEASRLGLRTLTLSEELGGAGADALTSCIVIEEIAAGDADMAATLAETVRLAKILFASGMTSARHERLLALFTGNEHCQLAFAEHEPGADPRLGIDYHRPLGAAAEMTTVAVRSGDEFVIGGIKDCVANAPVAGLFAVTAKIAGQASGVFIVPAETPGLSVRARETAWRHGPCGDVVFENCRVPAGNLLPRSASELVDEIEAYGDVLMQAIALGVGRAAYEAAVDYAKLRVQGGRPIIQHQAIATKLAEIAIKLDVARAAVWRVAWAADHPQAFADHSLPDLPLGMMSYVYVTQAMLEAAKEAAEVFGAMGVMRDMPMQKYVHDARIALHSGEGNREIKLRIAEALAGYRRPPPAAIAAE